MCSRKFQVGLLSCRDAGCCSVFILCRSLPQWPPFVPPQAIVTTSAQSQALWWRVAVFSRHQCSFTRSRSKLRQVPASLCAVSTTQRTSWVTGRPQRRAHRSLPQWFPVDAQACPDRWLLKRSSAGTCDPAAALLECSQQEQGPPCSTRWVGAIGAAFTAPDCSSSGVRDRGCDEARCVHTGRCWARWQSGHPWACWSVFADTFGQ